ncbi:NAD(P)/FAD-dependent oxidoreductase [Amphritea sp. HPY]|uniref:NAD(P)/FAD-dependent oxidoreductase n=1 Tax=Amphritea sp. HPY TaxID=3421652 RepID=UPI003D7EF0A4
MRQTDVVIIGAGPCGLFQVFELGLQGLKAVVIDSLDRAGGQCINLYPGKPVYDIPAIPAISAEDLTGRLLSQIAPFEPEFFFNETVAGIYGDAGAFQVSCTSGLRIQAKAVVIASGAGAFKPVQLKLAGIDVLRERSLFYQVKCPEQHRDKHVVILGGGDSALDWALQLEKIAASITLIHRTDRFRAQPASVKKMMQLCSDLKMQFFQGRVVEYSALQGELKSIKVAGRDGIVRRMELDHLLVFFGLSATSKQFGQWQLEQQFNQIVVDTQRFGTSREGIYAVGDINWYPGKRKLILSGFHEAALAAFAIKEQLLPGKKAYLQYTTTSPLMHQRLGVHPDISDLID